MANMIGNTLYITNHTNFPQIRRQCMCDYWSPNQNSYDGDTISSGHEFEICIYLYLYSIQRYGISHELKLLTAGRFSIQQRNLHQIKSHTRKDAWLNKRLRWWLSDTANSHDNINLVCGEEEHINLSQTIYLHAFSIEFQTKLTLFDFSLAYFITKNELYIRLKQYEQKIDVGVGGKAHWKYFCHNMKPYVYFSLSH